MSSVSYANAAAGAATGSGPLNGSSPTEVEFKVEQTTITDEVDDSSATTEEDVRDQEGDVTTEDVSSTKNSSKNAKKEKVKVNLAPAPVPKVSPWAKKTSSSAPVSLANVNEKHWPTPEVSVLDEQNGSHTKQKYVAPVVKSTGREKWVPFQAAVVMSGPKSAKGNNQTNNQKKSSKGKKGIKQQQEPKQGGAPRRNQRQTAASQKGEQQIEKRSEDKQDSTASVSTKSETLEKNNVEEKVSSSTDLQVAETNTASSQQEVSEKTEGGHSDSLENNNKGHYDNHHSRQYSNGGARRHNNRHQHGYPPFNNRNLNFIPTTYLPSGQVFQPRGFNQGFIPQQNGHPQQIDGFRRFNGFPAAPPNTFNNHYPLPIIPINPAVQQINQINAQDPVTSIAFQVDYYFSVQNLVKDIFLRKQMDSEGYIPLKAIANFYRVQHLSGGDLKLVVDALDSCGNLEYVGNKETFDLKLRAKENPLNWVLPADQRA